MQLQELVAWRENAASERFVAERARVPVITELEPWLVSEGIENKEEKGNQEHDKTDILSQNWCYKS